MNMFFCVFSPAHLYMVSSDERTLIFLWRMTTPPLFVPRLRYRVGHNIQNLLMRHNTKILLKLLRSKSSVSIGVVNYKDNIN